MRVRLLLLEIVTDMHGMLAACAPKERADAVSPIVNSFTVCLESLPKLIFSRFGGMCTLPTSCQLLRLVAEAGRDVAQVRAVRARRRQNAGREWDRHPGQAGRRWPRRGQAVRYAGRMQGGSRQRT